MSPPGGPTAGGPATGGPAAGGPAAGGPAAGGIGDGRLHPPSEVVERALAASTTDGCVVLVTDRSEAEVRFANNTTTTNGVRRSRGVTVVAVHGGPAGMSVGVASATGVEPVEELVAMAEADARDADPAEDAAALVEGSADGSFGEPVAVTDVSILGGVVGGLGEAFARARSAGRVLAGFAEHAVETTSLGSSTGLRRRHVQPTGRMQLVARTADGTGSAWAGVGTTDFADVSLTALEERVVTRLGWGRRTVDLEPGRYETLLPPDAVADLMCMAGEACGGREAEEGHSVFAAAGGGTRVGEQLADAPVVLRSDPAEAGLECAPFLATGASGTDVSVFDNGLDLARTAWIDGGRLARLRYHRAGAARSNVAAAAPIDNLVLELPGATATLDDMVARTRRGLLLTCLWYIREVDPATLLLTGLTRDGVYLVEDGEIVGAVNNFRWNESPVDLLGRAAEYGRSERALSREWNEWFPRTAMPAMRVPDFNMSSVSPAT